MVTEIEMIKTISSIFSSLMMLSTLFVPYIIAFYLYKKVVSVKVSRKLKALVYFFVLSILYVAYVKIGIYIAWNLVGSDQAVAYGFSIPIFFLSFVIWSWVGIARVLKNNFSHPFRGN